MVCGLLSGQNFNINLDNCAGMEGDTAGIRVIPRTVEFSDVEPGKVHKISITVKNISRSSKAIRYYAPQSKVGDL